METTENKYIRNDFDKAWIRFDGKEKTEHIKFDGEDGWKPLEEHSHITAKAFMQNYPVSEAEYEKLDKK